MFHVTIDFYNLGVIYFSYTSNILTYARIAFILKKSI